MTARGDVELRDQLLGGIQHGARTGHHHRIETVVRQHPDRRLVRNLPANFRDHEFCPHPSGEILGIDDRLFRKHPLHERGDPGRRRVREKYGSNLNPTA